MQQVRLYILISIQTESTDKKGIVMEFPELVKSRYSVRKFKKEPISDEELAAVLEVAKHSPTALNLQPQKIYVLKSDEAMAKIRSLCKCIYGAPMVLMMCYDETVCWRNPLIKGHKSGVTDVSILCDEIMLQAWSMGIGTCFVGLFDDVKLQRAFNLSEHIRPVALLPIGYPSDTCRPLAGMHDVTKPMKEMVRVI